MIKTLAIWIFIIHALSSSAQTFEISFSKIQYENQFRNFDQVNFTINNIALTSRDSIYRIKINEGFDDILAVYKSDSLFSIAKFKPGIKYKIRAACCCGVYEILPDTLGGRGKVLFANSSDEDLLLIVDETNSDSIPFGTQSDYIEALQSAMCYYKVAGILITSLAYAERKYLYQNMEKDMIDSLILEREGFILERINFQFLHKELLKINFDGEQVKIELEN